MRKMEEKKAEKTVNKKTKVKVKNQGKIIALAIIVALVIIFGSIYIFFGDKIFKENKVEEKETEIVELNKWDTVSKYNEKTEANENVKVRITKVAFGAEAEAIVRSYAESNKYVKYEGVYEGMQLVVAEYEIDFSEYTKNKFGDTVKVDASVLNNRGSNIETDESIYQDLPIRNISSDEKVKLDKIGVGYFEFQIPLNYQGTALKIGADGGTTKLFSIN